MPSMKDGMGIVALRKIAICLVDRLFVSATADNGGSWRRKCAVLKRLESFELQILVAVGDNSTDVGRQTIEAQCLNHCE